VSVERLIIEDGKLVRWHYVAPSDADNNEQYWMEYQLYDEQGQAATGNYKGPGAVTRSNGMLHVIVGDPYTATRLEEYTMDEDPTPSSLARFDGYAHGMKAKRYRAPTRRNPEWADGYYEAWRARGRTRF